MEAKNYMTGIASEYLVLSMLYRLGADAYITMGNKKSIDIGVIKEDGTRISIDVKSVRGYSSIPVDNIKVENNHFMVFVIYKNKFDDVSIMSKFYIVPCEVASRRKHIYGKHMRVHPINDLKEYENAWNLLKE